MRPNLQQQREYLFQVYFGIEGTHLDRFVSRAYRDMSRTFYGIGKLDPKLKTIVLKGAKAQVKQAFETLRAKHPAKTDAKRLLEFDTWHSASCDALIRRNGVRLLNLVNLDAGAVGLLDGMDGATAAIVCTGNSLSRDRTW